MQKICFFLGIKKSEKVPHPVADSSIKTQKDLEGNLQPKTPKGSSDEIRRIAKRYESQIALKKLTEDIFTCLAEHYYDKLKSLLDEKYIEMFTLYSGLQSRNSDTQSQHMVLLGIEADVHDFAHHIPGPLQEQLNKLKKDHKGVTQDIVNNLNKIISRMFMDLVNKKEQEKKEKQKQQEQQKRERERILNNLWTLWKPVFQQNLQKYYAHKIKAEIEGMNSKEVQYKLDTLEKYTNEQKVQMVKRILSSENRSAVKETYDGIQSETGDIMDSYNNMNSEQQANIKRSIQEREIALNSEFRCQISAELVRQYWEEELQQKLEKEAELAKYEEIHEGKRGRFRLQ